LRGADLYQPALNPWSVVWRLFASPWLPLWAALFNYQNISRYPVWELLLDVLARTLVVGVELSIATVVLGYPAYLLFRRLGWANALGYVLGGALVAPLAIVALTLVLLRNIEVALQVTMVVLWYALPCGGAAGLIFWALLRFRRRPAQI
jgi:hypothetical protein